MKKNRRAKRKPMYCPFCLRKAKLIKYSSGYIGECLYCDESFYSFEMIGEKK